MFYLFKSCSSLNVSLQKAKLLLTALTPFQTLTGKEIEIDIEPTDKVKSVCVTH